MLTVLLFLIVGFVTYSIYIYVFDHTERHYDANSKNQPISVSISPRTGKTDSWTKNVKKKGKSIPYLGTIYDVTLNNTGDCDISTWLFQLNIPEHCYINNAWCGNVEIHQTKDHKVQKQTLNLRNYDTSKITLDYTILDPDLLIPLNTNDYLIYHPDKETNEYPLLAQVKGRDTQVVFGMIFYVVSKEAIDFNSFHLTYFMRKGYTQSPFFWVLFAISCLWFICLIIFATLEVNMRKAHIRFVQDEHIIRQSIGVFTRFFEAKDTYTKGHSQRVAQYSRLIAEKLGWPEDECRQIYYIGLMHDCGKSYIPDDILKKPGKLTDEEYEIIKSHTVKGALMLKDFTSISHIRDGALYHHERFDGKGYPEGLSGEQIPLVSRIICISDAFDAMNSKRCYRDMLTKDYIISELTKNRGKQFDPHLVPIFLDLLRNGEIEFTEQNKK